MTTFDISALVDVGPGNLGPPNTKELLPGIFIPDPAANDLWPGIVSDRNVRMPLYASDITVLPPGAKGPYGYMELGHKTGVWIPNPRMNDFRPGFYTPPAGEKPIQIEDITFLRPGDPGPRGYIPLGDSGVWLPGPPENALSVHPSGHATGPDDADHHGKSGKDVFDVNYHHLEGLAQRHDEQAGQVAQWADAEKGFADRLLETHGKVAYATYLNVKGYNDSRHVEAGAYAQRNADTAVGLRGAIASTRATDESSAAAFKPPTSGKGVSTV